MKNKFLNFLGIAKRAGKVVEGYNNCEEDIKRKRVSLCILSAECSDRTKKRFKKYCEEGNILLIENISSEELSSAIGREAINVLAVKDSLMCKNLMKLWKENYEL